MPWLNRVRASSSWAMTASGWASSRAPTRLWPDRGYPMNRQKVSTREKSIRSCQASARRRTGASGRRASGAAGGESGVAFRLRGGEDSGISSSYGGRGRDQPPTVVGEESAQAGDIIGRPMTVLTDSIRSLRGRRGYRGDPARVED